MKDPQNITRIAKSDGCQTLTDEKTLERVLRFNHGDARAEAMLTAFRAGARVETVLAYYEKKTEVATNV